MKQKNLFQICKNDLILAAALAAAAFILFLVFLFGQGNEPGDQIAIKLNGTEYGIYSLNEDRDIRIDSENGTNLIRIENGTVCMADADCPDQYCISKGSIFRTGETIVCLPHRLVVEVIRNEQTQEEYDIIAQ